MDLGHYNCRDYAISPQFTTPTRTTEHRWLQHQHESFDELEARSRSPASQKPKFPLLKLPLELRQEILRYLLPSTIEYRDAHPLSEHARNFSAVKKRQARGMFVPQGGSQNRAANNVNNVVWQRGNIRVFSVCKQLHDECAELMYGMNTFLLFVNYAIVKFRYRWLLPSGMTPIREYQFLETMPPQYMRLVRNVVINVDHVDPYMGMVKFNVSGKGLAVGLRDRLLKLVDALRALKPPADGNNFASVDAGCQGVKHMSRVVVRVSDGSGTVDPMRCEAMRVRDGDARTGEEIEMILSPLSYLRSVRNAVVNGSIRPSLARALEEHMMSFGGISETRSDSAIDFHHTEL